MSMPRRSSSIGSGSWGVARAARRTLSAFGFFTGLLSLPPEEEEADAPSTGASSEAPLPPPRVIDAALDAVSSGRLDELRRILDEEVGGGVSLTRLRGPFGNTMLHRAYGFRQRAVARFLLEREPALIRCVYDKPAFRGENVLHMVIAQGDTSEAKFLCARCPELVYGRADSEMKRDVARAGGLYLGELPLSFSVAFYNAEIAEYLVREQGVLISCGDYLGNTAAHMCVFWDRFEMFSVLNALWEKGYGRPPEHASTPLAAIRNRAGQSLLVLAASLGRLDFFSRLWSASREINWSFGSKTLYRYPLDFIDASAQLAFTATECGGGPLAPAYAASAASLVPPAPSFQPHVPGGGYDFESPPLSGSGAGAAGGGAGGALSPRAQAPLVSALEAAVEGGATELFQSPVLASLVNKKWSVFGRPLLLRRVAFMAAHLLLFAVAAILRASLHAAAAAAREDGGSLCAAAGSSSSSSSGGSGGGGGGGGGGAPACAAAAHVLDDQWLLRSPWSCRAGAWGRCAATTAAELGVIAMATSTLVYHALRIARLGIAPAMRLRGAAPVEKTLSIGSAGALLAGYALDWLLGWQSGATLLAIAAVCGWLYCGAMYLLASPATGPFILMLSTMVTSDLALFAGLSACILVAFTHAFVVLDPAGGLFAFIGTFRHLAISMIGQNIPDAPGENVAGELFAVSFTVVACLLMLNLLVALLSNTFAVFLASASGHYHFAITAMMLEDEERLSSSRRLDASHSYWEALRGRIYLPFEEVIVRADTTLFKDESASAALVTQRISQMPSRAAATEAASAEAAASAKAAAVAAAAAAAAAAVEAAASLSSPRSPRLFRDSLERAPSLHQLVEDLEEDDEVLPWGGEASDTPASSPRAASSEISPARTPSSSFERKPPLPPPRLPS